MTTHDGRAMFVGGPVMGNLERRFTMGGVDDQRRVFCQCGQCGARTYGTAKDEGPLVACDKCGPSGSYRVGVDPSAKLRVVNAGVRTALREQQRAEAQDALGHTLALADGDGVCPFDVGVFYEPADGGGVARRCTKIDRTKRRWEAHLASDNGKFALSVWGFGGESLDACGWRPARGHGVGVAPKAKCPTHVLENSTASDCLAVAQEVAREMMLDVGTHIFGVGAWEINVYDWNTPAQRNATERARVVNDYYNTMAALVPRDVSLIVRHAGDTGAPQRVSTSDAFADAQEAKAVARAAEADALRRELETPPRGYSVAVWKAHCCAASEDANGSPNPLNSADVAALRGWVDDGSGPVPERLLIADRSQLIDKPLHAYRFSRRGGR